MRRFFAEQILPPALAFALLLGLWQGAIWVFRLPAFLLPSPLSVGEVLISDAPRITLATYYTFVTALAGFAASLLVGVGVSFAFAQSTLLRRAGYPYAIFLQTVPIIAIAPLIIAIFGAHWLSIVAIAAIISLFPIITNTTAGLLAVDPRLDELFKILRASRMARLRKLQIPTAIPYLVTGAKVSCGLAMVGAIVGEFVAGYGENRFGLGRLIQANSDTLKTDRMMAAVLAAALLGILIFAAVNLLAAWLLRRWTEK